MSRVFVLFIEKHVPHFCGQNYQILYKDIKFYFLDVFLPLKINNKRDWLLWFLLNRTREYKASNNWAEVLLYWYCSFAIEMKGNWQMGPKYYTLYFSYSVESQNFNIFFFNLPSFHVSNSPSPYHLNYNSSKCFLIDKKTTYERRPCWLATNNQTNSVETTMRLV